MDPPATLSPNAEAGDAPIWLARCQREPGDGPLRGLRFAVKDNIDVAGVPTTAACPEFAYVAQADAEVVRRLCVAGAVPVGKTNLDQFACGLNGTRSPYGAVPNSFDARYVAGGSSAGSAVAVALGQVDFALGTDTAGSGRVPAGFNNIVGLKPTRGLISTRGVVPAARSLDCVSIFARSVAEAVRVCRIAAGFDAGDPFSRHVTLDSRAFAARFRFAVPRANELEFFGDSESRRGFEDAVRRLQALGGTAVQFDFSPFAQAAGMLYESALSAERHAAIRTFFDQHPTAIEPSVRAILTRASQFKGADVFEAQAAVQGLAQSATRLWSSADVMLVPTAPTIYTIEQMRADPIELNRRLGYYTNFVNLFDLAAISIPSAMRADGLPFGITFIGPAGSDLRLAEIGHCYHERAIQDNRLGLGAQGGASTLSEPDVDQPERMIDVAVVGAHLSGMPLNSQLVERGARCVRTSRTAAQYRLYALPGTTPPKPGMVRVNDGANGAAIEVEVWRMPIEQFGSFVALIPSPLGIGTVQLADGSNVKSFVCEDWATRGAEDISGLGGWRAYIDSRKES